MIARDDDDVVVCHARVGGRSDDGVDSRGRRLHPGAHCLPPKCTGGVTRRDVDGSDVHHIEQALYVVVVADMASQDTLGEDRGGQDEVVALISEQAQPSPALLVERCEPFDASSVEDGDQPAARCARGGGVRCFAAFRRGCAAAAELSQASAFALAFAEGGP